MFFRKKLKKPDPEAEQRLRNEIDEMGGLEKNDVPAMLISAFLVILPVAIGVLLILALVGWLLLS